MSALELPSVVPQPLTLIESWLRKVHERSRIAAFFFGDIHLWARDDGNNSALVLSTLLRIEQVVRQRASGSHFNVPELPLWILIGDTCDGKKAHRRSEPDALVEEALERYASLGRLALVTGNHDHEVIARPREVLRLQKERGKNKRGIIRDLSWLEHIALPACTMFAVAHDQVYLGPAAVSSGCVTAEVYEEQGGLPKYADLLVLLLGGRLFLVRHGDLYDTWYHRHPPKGDIPKRLKHELANLGSGAYEGIGWLRKRLERTGVNMRGAENRVKEWFNGELRTVCIDIAEGMSREAATMHAISRVPVGGTIAGHTHTPLFGTYGGYQHCNPGHSRGDVGVGIITEDGILHAPFVVADDR